MKRIVVLLFFVFTTNYVLGQSDYTLKFTPATEPIDAKSIALGESFVANPASSYSFMFNPANLSQLISTNLFFNRKSDIIFDDSSFDSYYYTVGFTAPTSIGGFALTYSQRNINIDAPYYGLLNQYKFQTIALGYAKDIVHNLSIGATIKALKWNSDIRPLDYYFNINSDFNFLADIGILFKINNPFFTAEPGTKNHLYLGASVQNLGAKFETKTESNYPGSERKVEYESIAKYLRAGFSYCVSVPTKLSNNTIEFVLSGEYKNLINPGESEKYYVDSFGAGLETKFFDVASINIGITTKTEYRAYFYIRGHVNFHYGFSVNLPLKYIFKDMPVAICFDFGVLPLTELSGYKDKSLTSFNLTMKWDGQLF